MEKGNDSQAKITIRWGSSRVWDEINLIPCCSPCFIGYQITPTSPTPMYPVYLGNTYPKMFSDFPIQAWITWGMTT